jgi:hypothetical protein
MDEVVSHWSAAFRFFILQIQTITLLVLILLENI